MEKGSLLDFLRQDKGQTLKLDGLCDIASHVASGMQFMEANNHIHRDLAARNVLLDKNNEAKICDFGLARLIQDEEYMARAGGKFPIKWTAPEAIDDGKFTIKSDVWSYGIFLMELFTYGETPYQGMICRVVVDMVRDGYRMGKPKNHVLPDEMYQLMLKCWEAMPENRPSFKYLEDYFEHIDFSYLKESVTPEQSIVVLHNKPNTYEEHTLLN